VDALPSERYVVAFDWRGFGRTLTENVQTPHPDAYWYPDYLADLDAALDALFFSSPGGLAIDLLGHSMGGNVAMLYAGLRPERIRRLINLEGFGMPATQATQAPSRLRRWLDELKTPVELRHYDNLDGVVKRLRKTNPRLDLQRATWLAQHWSQLRTDGKFEVLGDPAHIRSNPVLYQVDEALACWKLITAKVLWVEGDETEMERWWNGRYTLAEFHERLSSVPQIEKHQLSPAGHMLHHDQPKVLANLLEAFLGE
jgi:pimeloyl-ACP methyl ester carboxylesterase